MTEVKNESGNLISWSGSVDGLSFLSHAGKRDRVTADGWGGTYLKYFAGDEPTLIRLVSAVAGWRRYTGDIFIPTTKSRGITFTLSQEYNWILIKGKSSIRRLEYAKSNSERLTHVLTVYHQIQQYRTSNLEHFCADYGIEVD